MNKYKVFAYPLGWLYAVVVYVRNRLFDWGIVASAVPPCAAVAVGNLTAGGTGKTPHTEYLLRLLCSRFEHVAELSRGYKRKTKGFYEAAQGGTTALEIGDEAAQIARKFPSVKVAVDHKRVHGIALLKEKYPELQAVVLDDCFQHRYVKPTVNILLCDYARPYFRDHILPYGNLRESRSEARRADVIIVSKCPQNLSAEESREIAARIKPKNGQKLFFTTLDYDNPYPLFGKEDLPAAADTALLVTAIANPRPLQEYLKSKFPEVSSLCFDDHHFFNAEDWKLISESFRKTEGRKIMVVTEKDAAKIAESQLVPQDLKQSIYVQAVKTKFLFGQAEEFDNYIVNQIKKAYD